MQLHTESNNLKAHKIVPPTISDKHRHIGRNSAEADKYTFNSLDWTVALEWITRNMAEKILMSQNQKNRQYIRQKNIKQLKAEMEAGEFYTTPEGLIFDKQENLIDGQHRLMALLKSSLDGLLMIVWRNVEPVIFGKLNSGAQRSFQDRNRTSRDVQDVINQIARIHYGNEASHSQNKLILETFQAVVEWLYSVPFTHSKGLSQQPVRTAVVLRMIENPLHADWLQDQFCALTALEYNKMENSIQSLCRQITMDRISGWDLQIRAWRAFDYQRKNNKKIQVRDSSEDYQQMRRAIEKRLKAAVKTA